MFQLINPATVSTTSRRFQHAYGAMFSKAEEYVSKHKNAENTEPKYKISEKQKIKLEYLDKARTIVRRIVREEMMLRRLHDDTDSKSTEELADLKKLDDLVQSVNDCVDVFYKDSLEFYFKRIHKLDDLHTTVLGSQLKKAEEDETMFNRSMTGTGSTSAKDIEKKKSEKKKADVDDKKKALKKQQDENWTKFLEGEKIVFNYKPLFEVVSTVPTKSHLLFSDFTGVDAIDTDPEVETPGSSEDELLSSSDEHFHNSHTAKKNAFRKLISTNAKAKMKNDESEDGDSNVSGANENEEDDEISEESKDDDAKDDDYEDGVDESDGSEDSSNEDSE